MNAPCAITWLGVQATWMWRDRRLRYVPARVVERASATARRVVAPPCVAMVKRKRAVLRCETRSLLIDVVCVCVAALPVVVVCACSSALWVRFGLVVVRVCARTTYVTGETINPWLS